MTIAINMVEEGQGGKGRSFDAGKLGRMNGMRGGRGNKRLSILFMRKLGQVISDTDWR